MRLAIVLVLCALVGGCGLMVRLEPEPDGGGPETEGCHGDEDCPEGTRCEGGDCVAADPCRDVECPDDQVCSGGDCLDPRVDEDGDGFPVESDCDDRDRFVIPGSTRECSTDCGAGTKTCVDAEWTPCTAPADCTCEAGQKRQEPCGNCGQAQRTCGEDGRWEMQTGPCEDEGECSAGSTQLGGCEGASECAQRSRRCDDFCRWEPWGPCDDPAECAPGEIDEEDCGNCGTRQRICNEQCLWPHFEGCRDVGECAPGEEQPEPCGNCGTRTRACTNTCLWGDWGDCGDGACVPGRVENEPCGLCGTRSQTCGDDCNWGDWTDCEDPGVCDPGTQEDLTCGHCGTKSRRCRDDCTWGQYSACLGEGPCSLGDLPLEGPCGNCGSQTYECSSECQWDPEGDCEGEGECAPTSLGTEDCGDCGTQALVCGEDCTWSEVGDCDCMGSLEQGVCDELCGGVALCGGSMTCELGECSVPCHCEDPNVGEGCPGDVIQGNDVEFCPCGGAARCAEVGGGCDWEIACLFPCPY